MLKVRAGRYHLHVRFSGPRDPRLAGTRIGWPSCQARELAESDAHVWMSHVWMYRHDHCPCHRPLYHSAADDESDGEIPWEAQFEPAEGRPGYVRQVQMVPVIRS